MTRIAEHRMKELREKSIVEIYLIAKLTISKDILALDVFMKQTIYRFNLLQYYETIMAQMSQYNS